MKYLTNKTYYTFCIFFMLFTLIWLGVRVYSTTQSNKLNYSRHFNAVSHTAYNIYNTYGYNNRTGLLNKYLSAHISTSPEIKVFLIYNQNGELLYLFSKHSAYLYNFEPANTLLRNDIEYASYNSMQTILTRQKGELIAEGLYESITNQDIFSVLLEISIFLIAFLLINAFYLGRAGYKANNQINLDYEQSIKLAKQPNSSIDNRVSDNNMKENDTFKVNNVTDNLIDFTDTSESEIVEKKSSREDCKQSLFSPSTGLCWQEYTMERLTYELKRAAANDQDLVLVLISIKNENDYNNIASFLIEHFQLRDLLFEYDKNGFAVIIPNTDLDEGIKIIANFKKILLQKKHASSDNPIFIGLSSRNGRLINGECLIKEAALSITKAKDDPESGFFGFRPDPVKYRSYIAKKHYASL